MALMNELKVYLIFMPKSNMNKIKLYSIYKYF